MHFSQVILIFGISGALRGDEIVNIKIEDIKEEGNLLLVNVPKTKTNVQRKFTINDTFVSTVKKYKALRPSSLPTGRFFLNYQKSRCTSQVIGKNKIAKVPQEIAQLLKLENPELYTGHCFRRTSATLLADFGANITTLKRHGGWKSDTVAEGYIADSIQNKKRTGDVIASSVTSSNHQDIDFLDSPCNVIPENNVSLQNDVMRPNKKRATGEVIVSSGADSNDQNIDYFDPPFVVVPENDVSSHNDVTLQNNILSQNNVPLQRQIELMNCNNFNITINNYMK